LCYLKDLAVSLSLQKSYAAPRMSLRTLLLIGSLAALTGCGSSVMTFEAVSSVSDTTKNNELFKATERVLLRRLAGAEVKGSTVSVIPEDSGTASVSISVPSDAMETVQRITSDPFTFEIRLANGTIKDDEGNDQVDWQATGIDGTKLDWIQTLQGPKPEDIGVELQFNAEGKNKLSAVFLENVGKDVGIFVRDLLVSKLKVNTTEAADHIIIGGIPSAKIAEIFADDVNVGLHITFTPSK